MNQLHVNHLLLERGLDEVRRDFVPRGEGLVAICTGCWVRWIFLALDEFFAIGLDRADLDQLCRP